MKSQRGISRQKCNSRSFSQLKASPQRQGTQYRFTTHDKIITQIDGQVIDNCLGENVLPSQRDPVGLPFRALLCCLRPKGCQVCCLRQQSQQGEFSCVLGQRQKQSKRLKIVVVATEKYEIDLDLGR